MFEVTIYADQNGNSELNNQLEELATKAPHNKNSRIQYNQIILAIEKLETHGANSRYIDTKPIQKDIWELRPGDNRILYFYFENNTYVLLHMFRKKTQKTPKREIEKAIREKDDYKRRNGGKIK